MLRSPTMASDNSLSGYPKALKIFSAVFLNRFRSICWCFCRFVIATFNAPFPSVRFFFFLEGRLRVFYPLMVDAGQYPVETLGDLMEILECQLALIQLTVNEDVIDNLLHHPLDTRRRRIGQCP